MRTIAIIGVAAIAGGLSLALSVPPARSQSPIPQPSFDCSRVTTQIERTICADLELAQWDGRMGQAFKRKYAQLGSDQRGALLKDQRRWIALRNGQCDVATLNLSAKPCILQLTKARVATLEDNTGWKAVAAGSADTPSHASSVLADDDKDITDSAYCLGVYQGDLEELKVVSHYNEQMAEFSEAKKKVLSKQAFVDGAIRQGKIDGDAASKAARIGYADGSSCWQKLLKCDKAADEQIDNHVDNIKMRDQLQKCQNNVQPICDRVYEKCEKIF